MKKLALILGLSLSVPAFAVECDDIELPTGVEWSYLESCKIEDNRATIVDENEKYGYVNSKGELVIAPQFDEAWAFQEGLAVVKVDDKWGYINPTGDFVVQPTYDDAWGFSEGLAKVIKNGKVGFINLKGNVVIPLSYDDSYHWFDEGFTAVSKKDKWGIINKQGKAITPLSYDYATSPSEGRILVGNYDKAGELKYGYLDTQGKVVIPLQYDYATSFSDGTAYVDKDGESLLINKKGQTVEAKDSFDEF